MKTPYTGQVGEGCPTIRHNKIYRRESGFGLIRHSNRTGKLLLHWIEKLGYFLAGYKNLFLIDDINADDILDKRRQSLLESAISGEDIKVIRFGG